MRRARVDTNQKAIVDALRKAGATVLHLHTVGQGCPDLLCGYKGRNVLLEIKDGTRKPSERKLTPAETMFFQTWRGQVVKVESATEALLAVWAAVS